MGSSEVRVSQVYFTRNQVTDFRGITMNTTVAGPISGPKDAEYVLQRTKNVHGFYGASSMERLPVEEAIAGTMQQYKAIQISG